jgi:hypothetical protein
MYGYVVPVATVSAPRQQGVSNTIAPVDTRTELRKRAQHEEIPIVQHRQTKTPLTRRQSRQAALDQRVLELLEHGILDDRIDDQQERRADAPPKTGRTVLGHDFFDRLEDPELLGRVREVDVDAVNRL